MAKIIVILYLVCFGCYVLFTRQPDYFDGEFTQAIIIQKSDSLFATYTDGKQRHLASVPYPFMFKTGDKVQVIYETSTSATGKVYSFFGYWITFGELIASVFIIVVLYFISVKVTSNPTPEALLEELEASKKQPRKPKYDL